MDRGHVQAVDRVEVTVDPDRIRLAPLPCPGAALRLELWGGNRKSELLAELAGAEVEIVAPDGSTVFEARDDGEAEGEDAE
jgi:hypothetical protein